MRRGFGAKPSAPSRRWTGKPANGAGRKSGQVAKHMTVALPREATAEQRQAMLMEFVQNEIQPQLHGVVVEWAIHRDDNNPHAHLLISTRSLVRRRFWQKGAGDEPGFCQ